LDRTLSILSVMENSSDRDLWPSKTTYSTLLHSMAFCFKTERDSQTKQNLTIRMSGLVLHWCRRSESIQRDHQAHLTPPGWGAFSLALHSLAASYSKVAGRKALQLLETMHVQYKAGNIAARPDAIVGVAVLKTLTDGYMEFSVTTANTVLDILKDCGVKQTLELFNAYIAFVAKFDVEKAYSLIEEEELGLENGKSDILLYERSYYPILHEYTLQGNIEKVVELFQRMNEISQRPGRQTVRPGLITYTTMIDAWGRTKSLNAIERIEECFKGLKRITRTSPNHRAYTTLLNALNRIQAPNVPQRLEHILSEMQQDYDSGVNRLALPDVHNFAMVIKRWSYCNEEGFEDRAESLLHHLEDLYLHSSDAYAHLKPIESCYRSVFRAWSCSQREDASARALALLDRMKLLHERNKRMVQPNSVCCLLALKTLNRSRMTNSSKHALSLIQDMNISYNNGNHHIQPNQHTILWL
jgi:tetratricopeptide (TPR) repeat protein